MNATDLNNIATRLQSFWDRLANDPVAGTKFEGDSAVLEDAIVKLRHIAAAERAVSPAESVQSCVDDEELRELVVQLKRYPALSSPVDDLHKYINASRAAAHAEGRRSAMEELEAKIEAAARDKDGNHVDDLRGWLDETREENEVQGVAFHACSLKLKQAEEELAKEKERADRAEHNLEQVKLAYQFERQRAVNAECEVARLIAAARQAPDLSKLTRYTYDGAGEYTPTASGEAYLVEDVQALLAQLLQQEGGKVEIGRDEQAQRADAAIAGCKRWCGDGECKDACVERDARLSDNLQQASTAQADPAYASPALGFFNGDPASTGIVSAQLLDKEAAIATDAGQVITPQMIEAFTDAVPTLTRDQAGHPNDEGRLNWRGLDDDAVLGHCIAAAIAATPAQATPEGADLPQNGVNHG